MRTFLVRHAKAKKRAEWPGRDLHRPLSPLGRRQSFGLLQHLEPEKIASIITSPSLRCVQTVAPLAFRSGLSLEDDVRLAEDSTAEAALGLLRTLSERTHVLCSHGNIIPPLLERLEDEGVAIDGDIRCPKGSMWVLEGPGRKIVRARYFAPLEHPRYPDFPARENELRVAVLDLGSTSFRLIVADALPDGTFRRVAREREMLRLGSLVPRGADIPDDVRAQAIAAVRRLFAVVEKNRTELLLPVATSALREAPNGAEIVAALGAEMRVPVRVLTGVEEARLMFAAFRHRFVLPKANSLGIDLGGGSLELAVGDRSMVHWETTLPLGVVRLTAELVHSDPLSNAERRAIRARTRELLLPHCASIKGLEPQLRLATGGTIRALGRRVLARRGEVSARSTHGLEITATELTELADELSHSSHAERLRTAGIDERRADLLPTGALVLAELAEQLKLTSITVSEWGLREGVMLEALAL